MMKTGFRQAGQGERAGNRRGMREFKRTLPNGEEHGLAVDGDFLTLKAAVAPLSVIVGGQAVKIFVGDVLRFDQPFSEIRVKNSSGASVDYVLVAGYGEYRARTKEMAPVYVNVFNGNLADASAASFGGGGEQVALIVCNKDASTGPITVGGLEVLPGNTLLLETSSELTISNFSGAAQGAVISRLLRPESQ